MPNVKIVEGSTEDFSVIHDADWAAVPRVGEFITYPGSTDELIEWEVVRVSYVADRAETLRPRIATGPKYFQSIVKLRMFAMILKNDEIGIRVVVPVLVYVMNNGTVWQRMT